MAASPKFVNSTSASLTAQSRNMQTYPVTGKQVVVTFENVNGNPMPDLVGDITCFCEADLTTVGAADVAVEMVGMKKVNGVLTPTGTGKATGFCLGLGYKIASSILANYKKYLDSNGAKEMGVRTTDFECVIAPGGKPFFLLVAHLSVGNPRTALQNLKRYRILKSLMIQAHHLEKKHGVPVIMIGDFNTTRADLLTFRSNEEGNKIPKSTGNATFGDFKTVFRLDGSGADSAGAPLNLETALDLDETSPNYGKWFDIDHVFMPKHLTLIDFSIDRSMIGIEGENGVYDHARISLTFAF